MFCKLLLPFAYINEYYLKQAYGAKYHPVHLRDRLLLGNNVLLKAIVQNLGAKYKSIMTSPFGQLSYNKSVLFEDDFSDKLNRIIMEVIPAIGTLEYAIENRDFLNSSFEEKITAFLDEEDRGLTPVCIPFDDLPYIEDDKV